MSDYIKKADAIRTLLEALNTNTLYAARAGAAIGKLPAVDAVPVVRCGECMHRNRYECNHISLGSTQLGVRDDWYCADGIRRAKE